MIKHLETQHSGNQDLELLQQNLKKFTKALEDNPLLDGVLIKNAARAGQNTPGLIVGNNTINHKLGRKLQGWFVTRLYGTPAAAPFLYDTQATNQDASSTLVLVSAAVCNIDLWVF